ncbi:MAG: glycosyl hydrolase family 43 [Acidimicrobiales bacterium]|nr:glycosyl hydrolase family 43 [Acidimicrobiales bacterium]
MPLHRSRRLLRASAGLIGLASLLAACRPALGRPAVRQRAVAPRVHDNADPFVLNAKGQLFLFGTSNNKHVPVRPVTGFGQSMADSKAYWDAKAGDAAANDAMPTRPAWVDKGEAEIWAPTVAKMGTGYVMYFAGHRAGATDEWNDLCVGRAHSATPAGPYAPETEPAYCGSRKVDAAANWWGHGALDPEVVRAPDGRFYLLVALSRTNHNIGVVKLTGDGTVVGGINAAPTTLVSHSFSIPWHDGTDDSSHSNLFTFIENPSMIYEPASETYLLFYSVGAWDTPRYLTGFARCSTPMGPCTVDERGPFLKGSGSRTGTGGLTAFTDGQGIPRVAYSSWAAGHEAPFGPGENPGGIYSRQVSWGRLVVSGSDAATQTVRLQ